MAQRIMIVEDDEVIAAAIARHLSGWGYEVRCAQDFARVADEAREFSPHLVLMDVSLPCHNGFYWCAQLRRFTLSPIVFLSSREENMNVVLAVEMGADDYLAKPVSMEVLAAKVRAMLRRTYDYEAGEERQSVGRALLDAASSSLRLGDTRVPLTKNELRILATLLARKGKVVPREQIMLALWDSDAFVDDNTLTVNMARLRKTLERADVGARIVTHKGQGYAIDDENADGLL